LKIFVSTEATESQINGVMSRLRADDRVAEVRFLTADEALAEVGEKHSELTGELSTNPLPHEIRVTPSETADIDALREDYRALGLPASQDGRDLKTGLACV
jgi:cell division protein FtsX